MDKLDIYLSPEEVADRLKLNVRTITNFVQSGKLKGYKVSVHKIRIKESDLEKFMEEKSNV